MAGAIARAIAHLSFLVLEGLCGNRAPWTAVEPKVSCEHMWGGLTGTIGERHLLRPHALAAAAAAEYIDAAWRAQGYAPERETFR